MRYIGHAVVGIFRACLQCGATLVAARTQKSWLFCVVAIDEGHSWTDSIPVAGYAAGASAVIQTEVRRAARIFIGAHGAPSFTWRSRDKGYCKT